MKIDVQNRGNVSILDISGKLTMGEGDVVLRDKMKSLIEAGDRTFLLNMLQVPYMDSSGIGEMVAASKRVREAGGTMKLVLSPKGKQILMIPQLHLIFDIFADVETALASYQE